MTAPRVLPSDPFTALEDAVNAELAGWRDPTIVWLGRAVFAGSILATGAAGAAAVWLVLRVTGWLQP